MSSITIPPILQVKKLRYKEASSPTDNRQLMQQSDLGSLILESLLASTT